MVDRFALPVSDWNRTSRLRINYWLTLFRNFQIGLCKSPSLVPYEERTRGLLQLILLDIDGLSTLGVAMAKSAESTHLVEVDALEGEDLEDELNCVDDIPASSPSTFPFEGYAIR